MPKPYISTSQQDKNKSSICQAQEFPRPQLPNLYSNILFISLYLKNGNSRFLAIINNPLKPANAGL